MVITMTRYKRCELEKAVEEKISQGWEFVGNGIVEINSEKKNWAFEGQRPSKYAGRTSQTKYMVKMKREKPVA